MKRQPIAMVNRTQQINNHKIECYQIIWNTTDNNTPITRVYKRLRGGYGVICYCQAHRYKKDCYHQELARAFVHDALSSDTPTTDTHTTDKGTDTP